MENEMQVYVFARSHSLIHYLKISVKRQKIESRIQGNTPKFNNIKLICFLFILYMGLNVYVRAYLYCVCSLLHIPDTEHQSGPVCLTLPPPHSFHPDTVARISSAMCDRVKVPPFSLAASGRGGATAGSLNQSK